MAPHAEPKVITLSVCCSGSTSHKVDEWGSPVPQLKILQRGSSNPSAGEALIAAEALEGPPSHSG